MGEATLPYLSAQELARAYRARDLSPVEATTAILDRIDAVDATLRAYAFVDRDGSLRAARDAEERFARGRARGPLDGIPVSVKDLLFVRGLPTAAGSPALREFVPDVDEVSVERLRAAGAVILGKTTVPELGFGPGTQSPLVGVSTNPWDPTLTPGGSSGGAAAAVAAGLGPIALGTDAGGSIRAPAGFCGVVGLKPSFGRVPMHPAARDDSFPVFSGFETFDVVGPITRTVRDATLVLDVIAGPDPRDRHSIPAEADGFDRDAATDLTGVRVGWTLELGAGVPVDAEVAEAVTAAADRFRELGARVEPVVLDLGDTRATFAPLAALELGALRAWAASHPEATNERVDRLVRERWTFEDVSEAITARKTLHAMVSDLFEQVDLLITPTTPVTAYPHSVELPTLVDGRPMARAYDLSVFTAPFTLTGSPAASLPCGWTATGTPIGIQVVGGHRADGLVLRAAAAFESIAPWASRTPPL